MLRTLVRRALLVGALVLLTLPDPARAAGPAVVGGAITPVTSQIGVGFGFGFGHPAFFPGPGFVVGSFGTPDFVTPGLVVVPGSVIVGHPVFFKHGRGFTHGFRGSTVIISPGFGSTVIVVPPSKLVAPPPR